MAKTTSTKSTESKNARRYVIVGNQSYGLYYGEIEASDADILASKSVRMYNCRHISRWYGKTGGITSLAASGPCGSSVNDSRIGAPAPSALLSGVVNVLDCTAEAIENFAKVQAS